MAHVILRIGKCKKEVLAARRKHHKERNRLTNRENSEREKENVFWERDNKTMYEQAKELLEQHKRVTGRKARNDAIVMIDLVLTISPELSEELIMNKKEWINAQLDFVKKKFPHSKLACVSYEEDEQTPHLHLYINATDENGKLNAKKLVGNKKQLSQLQEDYEQYMINLHMFSNLEKRTKQAERKKGEKVFHKSIRQYWHDENEKLEKEFFEKKKQIEKEIEKQTDRLLEKEEKTKNENYIMHEADDLFW